MKNKNNQNVSFRVYLYRRLLFIALIAIITTGIFWITSEYNEFKKDAKSLRDSFINEQKAKIVFEVNNAIDYIQYNQVLLEKRLQDNIKERVYEAYSIAMNIYNTNKNGKTKSEISEMIKNALRPVRFNKGRGYYFAVSMDGVEKLYPVAPQFEEQNLINLQDEKGNYVIRDEIAIIKDKGEGFVWDYWRKPESGDEMIYPKITFVKYLEPLDWYIGTGEYLDDVEKDIQRECLDRLSQIRFGERGYIFVNKYNGDALISDGQIVKEPRNLWDLSDPAGNKVIQMERRAVEKPEGGFIEYHWRKMDGEVPEQKISFIRGFDEWEWMIGGGFHINDIEPEIDGLRANLEKNIQRNLLNIMMLLISLTVAVLFFSRYSYHKIWNHFQIFFNFFQKAADHSIIIDKDKIKIQEFSILADSTNEMIEKRNQVLQLLKESEEKYRLVVTHLGEGVVAMDSEYNFTYANPAAAEIFGVGEDGLEGRSLTDFQIDADKIDFESNEISIRNAKGKQRELVLTTTTRYNDNQHRAGTFAIIRDITAQKMLEKERNDNRERLKMIYKLLRHDLTNDFTVIKSALRLYHKNNEPEMLEEIEKRIRKGLDTIDIVRKQESLLTRPLELYAINLTEIINNLKLQYPQLLIEIEGNGIVLADEVIFSVFDNLISNAIIHGEASAVKVSIESKKEFCQISIADNGKGIPDHIKNEIFKEGFTFGKSGNTGIGLYIVDKTIERYGGSIIVQDNKPSGTIFVLKIRKGK